MSAWAPITVLSLTQVHITFSNPGGGDGPVLITPDNFNCRTLTALVSKSGRRLLSVEAQPIDTFGELFRGREPGIRCFDMGKLDDFERMPVPDRATWRAWLVEHHDSSAGIWLVYFKKDSGKPSVSYDEAVEEALCFGWIDSKVKSLDDERYMQVYTPRKTGSVWSKLNKERIERVIAEGLMTEVGIAKIDAAKQDGSWVLLDAVDDLIEPDELRAALDANHKARANYNSFADSVKKPTLYWVYSAKRETTRSDRIAQIVEAAAEGMSVAEYRAGPP